MRRSVRILALLLVVGAAAGCGGNPPIVTQQEVAIANATTETMEAPDPAVATSYYRVYGWMSPEEMERLKVPYDPTMDDGTRYAIQQAVDDNLTGKGFQQSQPADFVIALSDAYLDNSRQAPGFGVLGEEFTLTSDSAGVQSGAYMNQEEYAPSSERLTFVFVDARTHRVIWTGRGDDVLKGLAMSNPRDTGDYYLGPPASPPPPGEVYTGTPYSPQQSDPNIDAAVEQALAPMPVPLPAPPSSMR
jgi:hypothetical protein